MVSSFSQFSKMSTYAPGPCPKKGCDSHDFDLPRKINLWRSITLSLSYPLHVDRQYIMLVQNNSAFKRVKSNVWFLEMQ